MSNKKLVTMVNATTSTVTSDDYDMWATNWAFQAYGSTTSGSGAATILIQVSNVDLDAAYITMGTITLTLGTTVTADGFASDASWKYVRAKVSAISGTGASVTVIACNQGN